MLVFAEGITFEQWPRASGEFAVGDYNDPVVNQSGFNGMPLAS